jgi:outer membrane protein OmpA-like peptidoglycan-associated protein
MHAVLEHKLLMSTPFHHSRPQGGALAPIVIILVALALSAAVFFLFTKKRIDANRDKSESVATANDHGTTAPAPPAKAAPVTPAAPAAGPTANAPAPTGKTPTAAPPAPFGFARPADVAVQLSRTLTAGDLAAASKLIAAGDPTQEAAALRMLEQVKALGFKSGAPADVQVIGQVDNAMRLSIPLVKADGTPTNARIQLDVEKDPKMGWKISTLHLPKDLESAIAAAPMPGAAPVVNPGGGAPLPSTKAKQLIVVDTAGPDAITLASTFVKSLLDLDYTSATKMVDEEKVPTVKLAGLCIVFEDGKYKLHESKPLLATIATPDTSWIIARVKSDLRNEETEFGIEMEKHHGNWQVIGLNLSRLLADNAKSSASVGVPYTPLVQNPKGGECIALYYEYDSAVLHPRAQAQLKIVAGVLKENPGKKLKITGHTDALGSDDYNIVLSQKRAEAVKQFFLDQGVPAKQVETTGIGKALPLSPNANPDGTDNPEGRSHNRRAEILLDF